MKILIAEDDITNKLVLESLLGAYGSVDCFEDGESAMKAIRKAMSSTAPYDLLCLDIMMPKRDGRSILEETRKLEEKAGVLLGHGVKIVMITCLSDSANVLGSFHDSCDGYIVKPVEKEKLVELLQELELV